MVRSTFPSQNAHQRRTTFRSCDVEKVHAVVARSNICKWKSYKHLTFGAALEVAMSKKCTPLWHEAHFEVKMYKAHQRRTTFRSCDVEKVHAVVAQSTFASSLQVKKLKAPHVRSSFRSCDVEKVHAVVARSTFRSQKCKKLTGLEHFWAFRSRSAWQAQGILHVVKSEKNVRVL